MEALLNEIRNCTVCADFLEHGPRPVVNASPRSRILIIGQAPGSRVHASGIPWDDPSGRRLRAWMRVDDATFYDPDNMAIVPMGFCYPGKGKSGDLPPRPECAPLWHNRLLSEINDLRLTLLIGQYAQQYYLKSRFKGTLTETVRNFEEFLPDGCLPLPHPSPRNQIWMKKNDWFERDLVPVLQELVKNALK